MRTPVDACLREEADRYRLRFRCENCTYFQTEDGRCSEGYPNEEHRERPLSEVNVIVFCKKFELL